MEKWKKYYITESIGEVFFAFSKWKVIKLLYSNHLAIVELENESFKGPNSCMHLNITCDYDNFLNLLESESIEIEYRLSKNMEIELYFKNYSPRFFIDSIWFESTF